MSAFAEALSHRSPFRLTPGGSALLLIDLQEEFRVDPRYPVPGYDAILARARSLVEAARAADVPVLHACFGRQPDGSDSPRLEARNPDGTPAFSVKGSASEPICPEVAPLAGEAVFEKSRASCFSHAGFRAHLDERGIDTLVVAGVWTDACVFATVQDAVLADRRVVLVKDACGSGSVFMHQVAVVNLANRLYGGAVATTAQATSLLQGRAETLWQCPRPVPFLYDAAAVPEIFAGL